MLPLSHLIPHKTVVPEISLKQIELANFVGTQLSGHIFHPATINQIFIYERLTTFIRHEHQANIHILGIWL
jgi:hypothetical protein